jgi:hypothetical protein
MRQQLLDLRLGEQRGQKVLCDLGRQQPVPVLREYRMIPYRIVDPQANEPTEQKIEIQPLHQLAFGTDRIEHLQQARPHQTFGRNRGATLGRIQCRELAIQR